MTPIVAAPGITQNITTSMEGQRGLHIVLGEDLVDSASGYRIQAVLDRVLVVRKVSIDVYTIEILPSHILCLNSFLPLIMVVSDSIRHRRNNNFYVVHEMLYNWISLLQLAQDIFYEVVTCIWSDDLVAMKGSREVNLLFYFVYSRIC